MSAFPQVLVRVNGEQLSMSPLSRELMIKRTVYLNGELTEDTALDVITQMQYLEDASAEPMILKINSAGGSVSAGLAIYDTMKALRCSVTTMAMGVAASMGALLLAAGTKGHRYASPNSRIMLHQPVGAGQEQAAELWNADENAQHTQYKLAGMFANATGRPLCAVVRDFNRNRWMSSREARICGLIDQIGFPREQPKNDRPYETNLRKPYQLVVKSWNGQQTAGVAAIAETCRASVRTVQNAMTVLPYMLSFDQKKRAENLLKNLQEKGIVVDLVDLSGILEEPEEL